MITAHIDGFKLVQNKRFPGTHLEESDIVLPEGSRIICSGSTMNIYVPEKVEWSGEGLPPVGTVCEVLGAFDTYVPVTILAHTKRSGAPVAVYQCDDEIGAFTASLFLPIRTPEQVAAEQKKREFEEIRMIIGRNSDIRDAAEELLEHGYRKQVQP